ncbi:MAG: hypothetical protein AB7H43_10735 [Acidimicrobiia bacterium]
MALASTVDYEELLGVTLEGADVTRVERLLELATQSVLASAHGQLIAEDVTVDLELIPVDGLIVLPQRPVTAVAEVVYQGSVLGAEDYRWTPGGDGRPAYLIRVVNGFDRGWTHPVTVTYTHGWATTPEQVVAAVVFLAAALRRAGDDDGRTVSTESVGSYSVGYRGDASGLPPDVVEMLDNLFGLHPPTSVAAVRAL